MSAPFQVGARVRSSGYVIQRRRDYWLGCGQTAQKSAAKDELDRAVALRGTVLGLREGKFAPWIVTVRFDGETVQHEALPGMFELAEDAR